MPFDVYCQARLRALEGEHIHESRLRDLRDLARSGEQTIVQRDACWPLPAKRLIRADADGQNPCSLETRMNVRQCLQAFYQQPCADH